VGEVRCPGGERFCARLITVPTHTGIGEPQIEQTIGALA